jgi:hypothetical protein
MVKNIGLEILTAVHALSIPEHKQKLVFSVPAVFLYVRLASARTVGLILFVFFI